MVGKDQRGMSSRMDGGTVWEELVAASKTDRKKMEVSQVSIVDPAPSHTSSGNSLVDHPLANCTLDSAIASVEASLRPGLVVAPLQSLR